MTIVLEKSDWDGGFESSVVLTSTTGKPVILIGSDDRKLITFELHGQKGAPWLSSDTSLQEMLSSVTA